jgi:RNA polymerase sigma-70 factor (ECF subfamily)
MASEISNSPADTADFEAVALPFLDALYGKALHLTRSPADASDLVQETFLRAYRAFSSFTPGTNCKAWLFTIQYSIFVNQYRKSQREPDLVSMDDLEEHFHRTLADENWAGDFSGVDWQGPEVNAALGKLPENFRTAVLLVDVEGLNYEEAAGVLACPVGTLRSRLFRARKILFLELRDYARQTGFIREPQV